MNSFRTLFFLLLLVTVGGATAAPPAPPAASVPSVAGNWLGTLNAGPGIALRVVFKIEKKPDNTLAATLDSPDQGAKNIAVDAVTLTDKTLRLDVKAIGGTYQGTLAPDGKSITGKWMQGGNALPLDLKRVDKTVEVRRPQEPKPPFPYGAENVSYRNDEAGIALAGTLTTPRGDGPFPAAILISGSGAQNRDEELLGHKPFLVLADSLTRHGIAVLRVDDRGVGGSGGKITEATTSDFAGDVRAGIAYLKGRKEIDGAKIGLIGHSEGGIIAPLVAARVPGEVAFVVLLAGTGQTGEQVMYQQAALIARAAGAPDAAIAQNRTIQERSFAVLKAEPDNAVAEKKLREIFASVPGADQPQAQNLISAQIKTTLTPWFRHFLTYDPRPTLRGVRCPVLALIGEKDLQVPPKDNLRAIEDALKAGGNPDVTVRELPGLNHLFQHARTGAPGEYATIEETFAPDALQLIGDWIIARVRP